VGRGEFDEAAGIVYWVEDAPKSDAGIGGPETRNTPAPRCRALRLGVNDDPKSKADWILTDACFVYPDHASLYWQSPKCSSFMKYDGTDARCLDVKLDPKTYKYFREDVAYATSASSKGSLPTTIVQTPLNGAAAGREETLVSCDDHISSFKVVSDRIIFECRGSLWSVPRQARPLRSTSPRDAASDSAGAATQ
jgi:hypothetical protein